MTTTAAAWAATMTEDELLQCCLDLARLRGVRTLHIRPGRTSDSWRTPVAGDGRGWPDLVLVGPRGVAYRELKTARGRVTPEQAAWLAALEAAGQDAGVWRPADWTSGRVRAEVDALAGRAVP